MVADPGGFIRGQFAWINWYKHFGFVYADNLNVNDFTIYILSTFKVLLGIFQ